MPRSMPVLPIVLLKRARLPAIRAETGENATHVMLACNTMCIMELTNG